VGSAEDEPKTAGPEASEPEASVRHRPRRPAGPLFIPRPRGAEPELEQWPPPDDAPDDSDSGRSFLGAVGQLAAAVLAVAAIVALFIAAAIAFGWIFP
jgi:hypothetical protein